MSTEPPAYLFTETQDWFSFHSDTWRELFKLVKNPEPRVLEIGSWEGRSAVFLSTELCREGGELVCIDHFDLMETEAGRERYRKVSHNLSLTGKPFRIIDQFSVPGLMTLLTEEISAASPGFDWIYVDGSHEADDTLLDGELAWRLARKDAIVIFDDYHWNKEPEDSIHHPKRGIDVILALHAGEYRRISSSEDSQLVVQKNTDMRIGFLVPDKVGSKETLRVALGHGPNIALTIDAEYAMAAAVAIHSAVAHTQGRVTIYVLGRSLGSDVQAKLRQAVSHDADATILFIDLPTTDRAPATIDDILPSGPTWYKLAMIPHLPVERVLYFDADILVRGDLKELWDTALEGNALAAAPDVGFPAGHDGVAVAPYFNAGVMLMDLSVIRRDLDGLYATASRLKDAKMQDQDVLNIHFRNKWLPLSLKWNAQGLGTYAEYHTPERASLSLEDMDAPNIIHFTGPVHPRLADVMNPFVQPFTAKPWGYMGAPGHPYADGWWDVCERTGWKGWRASPEYHELCARKVEETITTAIQEFREKATRCKTSCFALQ